MKNEQEHGVLKSQPFRNCLHHQGSDMINTQLTKIICRHKARVHGRVRACRASGWSLTSAVSGLDSHWTTL